jgi:putative ABC transport system permease protein
MRTLLQDLRYGIRILLGSPGFAALAIFTVALGVGANTAIFSIVDGVLLRPLPYPDPDRIVQLSDTRGNSPGIPLSFTKFSFFRDHNRSFDSLAAADFTGSFTLGGAVHEVPIQVPGVRVSKDFFRVLGVAPALGRTFLDREDREGGDQVAIISHALWVSRFGSDPAMVGRTIALDDQSTTIVGVMGPEFDFPARTAVWVPRVFDITVLTRLQIANGAGFLSVIGRLGPGVEQTQALAEVRTLVRQYDAAHPGYLDATDGTDIVPLREQLVGNVRATLWILLGAVGLVLLIAAANVANLLLARAAGRRKEIAIRGALGAGRSRLVAQFLTESVLLAGLGGALGLGIAYLSVQAVRRLGPAVLPRAEEVHIDGAVLAFTVVVALLTGIVFGLAPALHSSRLDLNEALKSTSRGATSGVHGRRLRSLLTASEIALAVILLTGAGLLIRGFLKLEGVDPGFRRDHLLTLRLPLPLVRYSRPELQSAFYDRLLERVDALPGVREAAVSSELPLGRGGIIYFFNIEGTPSLGPGRDPVAWTQFVSPRYFETMGTPILRGREFTDADRPDSGLVVIVNQAFARHYWPHENPIGRSLTYSREHITCRVVGVAADTKASGLAGFGPAEQMYIPYRQRPQLTMSLLVRTAAAPESLASAVRHEVYGVDPDQPVTGVQTMQEVVSASLAQPRLRVDVMGAFAALALTLSLIGIFGLVAWSVSQRTNEIGIRMALGAESDSLRWMVVREELWMILAGLAGGLAGALALARVLSTVLFGVSAFDAATYASVMAVLGIAAVAACLVAAQRAMQVDPIIALRSE